MQRKLKVRIPPEIYYDIVDIYRDGTGITKLIVELWKKPNDYDGVPEQLRKLWLVQTYGSKFPSP